MRGVIFFAVFCLPQPSFAEVLPLPTGIVIGVEGSNHGSAWMVLPRLNEENDLSVSARHRIDEGRCTACFGGGLVDIPLSPLTPEMENQPCAACWGGGNVVIPTESGLPGLPEQTSAEDMGGTDELSLAEMELVQTAVGRLFSGRSMLIDSSCVEPFIGSVSASDNALFGKAFRFSVVTPSEVFSKDRPNLWLSFSITVMSAGDAISWSGGEVARRAFIVDDLRFSRRGVCTPLFSGAPLPSSVGENFDSSVRLELESQIAGLIVAELGSDTPAWTSYFQPVP